jgi:Zn-dependent protease with chaperone function
MRYPPSPVVLLTLSLAVGGCALELGGPGGQVSRAPSPPASSPAAGTSATRPADPRDVQRLSRIMVPLLRAADHKYDPSQIRVGIVDDPTINAANAGAGRFLVTRGLLDKANDQQLQAVLAHEIAHDDLGHVAKAQTLGTGVGLGAALLSQIFPQTGGIAQIAGTLVTRAYSRSEELQADRHGAELLGRVGAPKGSMEQTLEWLRATEGSGGGGGFLSTHPGIDERIEALKRAND